MAIIFEASDSGKPENVKLRNIKDILKKEGAKHGKKSADYQLIGELGKLGLSDVAIYAGMYLARRKQKPYWTIDELKDQLTRGDFVDEKLRPLLDKGWPGFKGMKEDQKKRKALEIAKSVIDSEAETVRIVNEYLAASARGSTLAHQLTKGQLGQVAETIKSVATKIERMYGSDDKDVRRLLDSMSWDPDSKSTTTAWLNGVIKDLGAACAVAVRDLKDMKRDERDEKRLAIINSTIKGIEAQQRELDELERMGVLWPESDMAIDGPEGIVRYIRSLESDRARARDIIERYERRKAVINTVASEDAEEDAALLASKWSDEKVKALVSRTARQWAIGAGERAYDNLERSNAAAKLAAETLAKNKGLEEFLSREHPDPESELAGLFGARLASPDLLKGRPSTGGVEWAT